MVKKKIWWIVGAVVVASILFLTPYIASGVVKAKSWEYRGFTINADRVSLSWFGPQRVEKIHGKSADLGVNFDVDFVESDKGLLSMLTHFSLGKVTVEKPVLYIQPRKPTVRMGEETGEEQEQEPKREKELLFPLSQLDLREGSVRIVNPDGTLTRIDQTTIRLDNTENIIRLFLRGSSHEGEHNGTFSLESSFNPQSERNIAFMPLLPLHFSAKVEDFPSKVIDGVLTIFHDNRIYLQDWLGPIFNFDLSHEKDLYHLTLSSEHLNGKGTLEQRGEIFKAVEPVTFQWTLIPDALNHLLLSQDIPLKLQEKTALHFTLLELIGNPLELKSSFKLEVDPATFVNGENTSLKLDQLAFESNVNLLDDERKIAGTGQFRFNDTPFTVTIEGTTLLEILNPVCLEDCLKGQWNIFVDKMPMKLVELLLNSKTPLEAPLGPTLSVAFNLLQKGNETLLGMNIQNKALESNWILFSLENGNLKLKNPVQLAFSPLSSIEGVTFVKPLLIDIKQLQLAKNLNSSSFKLSVLGEEIDLPDLQMQGSTLRLEKRPLKEVLASFESNLHFQGELQKYFGDEMLISSETTVNLNDEAFDEIDPLIFKAKSDKLSFDAKFKMDRDFKVTPLSTINLIYTLTPEVVEHLAEPTELRLKLFASNTNFHLLNLKDSRFKAVVDSPSIKFQEKETLITLNNFEGAVSGDLSTDWINLTLYGTSGHNGLMDVNLEINDLFFGDKLSLQEACYRGKANFENFPSLFLEPLLKGQELFYFLLGKQFDATLDGSFLCNQDPTGLLGLHFKSQHLEIDTRFKMDEKSIRVYADPKADNKILLHISKEEAARISPELKSALNGGVTLDYIAIPNFLLIPTSLEQFVDTIEGFGQIQIDSFLVNDYPVPALEGGFECQPNSQPISIEVHHKDVNDLKLSVLLDRPLRAIDAWSDLDVKVAFSGKRLPLSYFASKMDVSPILQQQIRTLFNNDAEIQLLLDVYESRGPIDLAIKGTKCQMAGSFYVDESTIKLQKPLLLQMEVTPDIGKNILGEIVPLLSSVISANGAIQIEIDPQGFSIPVNNFKGTSFDRGIIDIGALTLTVDEEIEDILNFLKYTGSGTVQVWSTPVYFSLKNQAITLERFDFLVADRYPLSLWGKIDFLKDSVNLKVGLGAKTLDQVFDIQHLPSDFMLPLSLRGTLSDISLDKAKATAKIAALIAESKGSPEGVLLGNVLELLSGSFKEEAPPPPTTTPLPWESGEEEPTPQKQKPLKALLKGLEKAFLR